LSSHPQIGHSFILFPFFTKKTHLAAPFGVAKHPIGLAGAGELLAAIFTLLYQPEILMFWQGIRCRVFIFHSPTGILKPRFLANMAKTR
jgi:hypothetical protein